jgi:hypothetical protein
MELRALHRPDYAERLAAINEVHRLKHWWYRFTFRKPYYLYREKAFNG